MKLCKGLTILELLVTISIILILAGLLFSSGSGGVRRAKETTCLANMRQIHNAILLYESDMGGYPANNVRDAAFLPYLGGRAPSCWARDPRNGYLFDYVVYIPTKSDSRQEDKDCFYSRGGDFPVVQDINHVVESQAALVREKFMLIVRLNGSAVKTKGSFSTYAKNRESLPCPLADFSANH